MILTRLVGRKFIARKKNCVYTSLAFFQFLFLVVELCNCGDINMSIVRLKWNFFIFTSAGCYLIFTDTIYFRMSIDTHYANYKILSCIKPYNDEFFSVASDCLTLCYSIRRACIWSLFQIMFQNV